MSRKREKCYSKCQDYYYYYRLLEWNTHSPSLSLPGGTYPAYAEGREQSGGGRKGREEGGEWVEGTVHSVGLKEVTLHLEIISSFILHFFLSFFISRSETTELLSEDLVQYENRIEPTKRAMYNAHRRLLACLQGQQGSDLEKRLKKMPLMSLSHVMEDSCRELDTASSIRKILEVCCFIESTLAKVLAEHELQVEKDVLDPLFKLSEVLDVNDHERRRGREKGGVGERWRWMRAVGQGGGGSGERDTPCAGAKVDVLREEADEAWRKVEQSKDEYAADLYHFASKEEEYANYFLSLLEAQADYHRKSLKVLDTLMPGLKSAPNAAGESPSEQAAFGKPLQEHLESCQRQIALPIEACVMMLLEKGMKEEGLFRLAPAASVLKQLKSSLDSGAFNPEEFKYDPHAVAGALKSYLRELPHPLMTFNLYDEWFEAASEKDQETKVERLRDVCNKLPEGNYSNLR
uniref:SH3 domain-binding protein 1-like n=1 Tax=Callorhinchus milii TaxID=7868 RepID=A0A4W3HF82_CALMI